MDRIGKKESGAQGRKRRAREAAEAQRKADELSGATAKLAAEIGEPPIGDPTMSLPWFRRAQLVLLREVLKDPSIPVREKFAAVKQMSEAAGKTDRPASLAERLAAVEEALAGSKPKAAVEVKPTHGLSRPATARGGSRSRGPRPVPGPPAGPAGDER